MVPWLKMPPPPLAASSPWPSLPVMVASVTVMVPPAEFQRPPPSLLATLPATSVPTISTVPAPVRWRPPPLPGLAPVLLSDRVPAARAVSPPTASMPPPARRDPFRVMSVSETTRVPPLLSRPPPEPAVPLAVLAVIVAPVTVSRPPSL